MLYPTELRAHCLKRYGFCGIAANRQSGKSQPKRNKTEICGTLRHANGTVDGTVKPQSQNDPIGVCIFYEPATSQID